MNYLICALLNYHGLAIELPAEQCGLKVLGFKCVKLHTGEIGAVRSTQCYYGLSKWQEYVWRSTGITRQEAQQLRDGERP